MGNSTAKALLPLERGRVEYMHFSISYVVVVQFSIAGEIIK
jgi:hypothetical protein